MSLIGTLTSGVSALRSFTKGLEVIGKDAFAYNMKLAGDIVFPSTLRRIGDFAFSKDAKITGFTFNMTKAEYLKRGVTASAFRWNYRTGASEEGQLRFLG